MFGTPTDTDSDADSNQQQEAASADARGYGGNMMCDGGTEAPPVDATPPAEYPEDELREDFQDGLDALREHVPEATPVVKDGNNIVVWLGVFELASYDPDYNHDRVAVFVHLPAHFPDGDPHWVVTIPELKRTDTPDGSLSDQNHVKQNHESAQVIERQYDRNVNAVAWSVRWSNANMAPSKADHMRRAYEMVNKAFDLG